MRDMGQMRGRMDEMIRRMNVLNGACHTERLDKPID